MPRIVLIGLVVFASIYAFVDCVQTNRRIVRILPKPVWLLVVLVPVLGPIVWLVAGRTDARGGRPPQAPRRPPGPRGPDDDPEFLRRL
ncbi:membrane protein [Intrasporangium oryzae NRRL B-24470]|uniref:Membrane protein n=1 Tax=Intrasporangium oryzae NRRL B-24470 TaxID=1386089 RepID=W9G1E1_9MICO|nr:PLDc N-terminal domain-containing protein [Intrasporangium oryzae]EWS99910.1 membrane protein [Intrasporangium oryzae NRRL B-24470]